MSDWDAAAIAAAQAVSGITTNVASGRHASAENRKNREWQEKMYAKQLEDSRENWRMANEYNLPSAALQRIVDAGLNPLLYYGENGAMPQVTPAQNGSAPSGASGHATFENPMVNFGSTLAQMKMLQAQIDVLESQANKNDAEADLAGANTQLAWNQDDWYHATYDLEMAMKRKNYDKLAADVDWIMSQKNCLEAMTFKNLQYLTKSMSMMDKHFELSKAELDAKIWYNIEDIAVRNRNVNATLQSIAVAAYRAETDRMQTVQWIKESGARIKEIMARTDLTEQQKMTEIQKTTNQFLHNVGYATTGSENINGYAAALFYISGGFSGRFDDNIGTGSITPNMGITDLNRLLTPSGRDSSIYKHAPVRKNKHIY